jgi:protoporphyrinogen oxidase
VRSSKLPRRGIHLSEYQGNDPQALLSSRLAVIGAGASGLTVAHTLKQRGYESVTVLERSDRVGGKCLTIRHEDRPHDLGAVALTPGYETVRGLLNDVGGRAHAQRCRSRYLRLTRSGLRNTPPISGPLDRAKLAVQLLRFSAILRRNRQVRAPGFADAVPDLHRPFGEWARAHGVEKVAAVLEAKVTGYGYGFFDRTPAAYVLKLAAHGGRTLTVETGFSGLWARVAEGLHVDLETDVKRVERSDSGVTVETTAGERDFDAIVVTCSLDDAAKFLDASNAERELARPIRYNRYYSIAAVVQGIPRTRCIYLPDHLDRAHIGEPMFAFRRYADQDLVIFYSYGLGPDDADRVVEGVRRTVANLGGDVLEVVAVQPWSYFPHVLEDDLNAGYYRNFEAVQGENRTWYAGEILAFSDVESTSSYARDLVERFFS